MNLIVELINYTNKYLNELDLLTYVLPLPFTDDNILTQKCLLSKLLSNSSYLSKGQLYHTLLHIINLINSHTTNATLNAVDTTVATPNTVDTGNTISKSKTNKNMLDYNKYINVYDTVYKRNVEERVLNKRSTRLMDKSLEEVDSFTEIHTPEEIANSIFELLKMICDPLSVGFILIIGCKLLGNAVAESEVTSIIPLAGGVVQLLDPEEHCIKGVWCDPNLPPKAQSELCKILFLRLLSHAFNFPFPGTNTTQRFKHISILNVYGILFPKCLYNFLVKSLKFGRHYETGASGGSHEDSATNPCKCLRLSGSEDSHLFWGISESRLKTSYSSIKSQLPISPSNDIHKYLHSIYT
ncbi:hypothetical protein TpMuguga_01g00409 [Theileria parva strain Muguga]|uniref:Uncharacterized protein n=1 Tax=Theileria parva TaxID=5875 RepID=Q4N8Q5_THEPA|nr:uncharacterized protein TpMuguga_01g00409 [Theileria parva strain Muguga]EAN33653.1 hypothetical protein TpMuguga_01g00409 [Theileria parva strain Muguga]|eukprot:XP_765936.1 hypothetical protein [Theileria parva strain Muguga]